MGKKGKEKPNDRGKIKYPWAEAKQNSPTKTYAQKKNQLTHLKKPPNNSHKEKNSTTDADFAAGRSMGQGWGGTACRGGGRWGRKTGKQNQERKEMKHC